jgi:hypothetical protein
MKISGIEDSVVLDSIREQIPRVSLQNESRFLDFCVDNDVEAFFAEIYPDFSQGNESAEELFGITSPLDTDIAGMSIYVSSNPSIYFADKGDMNMLQSMAFKVYPVIDLIDRSGDRVLKLASSTHFYSVNAIEKYMDENPQYAFLCVPRLGKAPTATLLEEFAGWMNSKSYAFRILKASLTTDDTYTVRVAKSVRGIYSEAKCEKMAAKILRSYI